MSDMYYYILSALVSSLGVLYLTIVNSKRYKLSHIPTIGHTAPLLSYISAWKYLKDSGYVYDTIEEGYRKHPNGVFKVPTLTSWDVIVNGTTNVEEMSKAPIDVVSNSLAFAEFLQLDYTLGRGVTNHPYHVSVVRAAITRNIAAKFDEMRDEVGRGYAQAFERLRNDSEGAVAEEKGGSGEWVEAPVYQVTIRIVSKILARLSVGHPLCENEEFRELCGRAVRTLIKGRNLRFFPRFLRPIASRLLINVQKDLKRMAELLEPIVRFRLEQEEVHGGGDWPGKPNDVLMWLMDEAEKIGLERTPLDLATRLYFLSFASEDIAVALTNALRIIASRPADVYLNPLRAEIERVLAQDGGWTKNAVGRMYMLDSFLREVQRCFDIQPLHVSRRTIKPFMFSDGTLVPPGCTMYANSHGMYRDEERFTGAGKFDGFRYVMPGGSGFDGDVGGSVGEGREKEVNGDGSGNGNGNGGAGRKNSSDSEETVQRPTGSYKQPLLAKPALDYHAFGYGKHACPGRFSATYQLKTMVAHVLMTYDVRVNMPGANEKGRNGKERNGNGNGYKYTVPTDNGDLRLAGERDREGGGGGSKSGMGVDTKLWFRKR